MNCTISLFIAKEKVGGGVKDSFILYTEQKAIIDKLTDEQAGKLIKAIYEYVATDKMPELETTIDLVITPFKIALDKNKEKYQNVVVRNRENGMKGGRPKKPTGFFGNPMKPKKADNDNEYDNDNDTAIAVIESDSRADGSHQPDSCVDEVVKFYEQNFGTISPFIFETLNGYRSDFTDDIIIYAMQLAVKANAKTINYIKAILNNWQKANVKSLLDAKNENKKNTRGTKELNNTHKENTQFGDLNRFYIN